MLPEYFNGADELCQFCVHRDRIVDCQKKFAQRTLVTEGWRWTCVARHKAYIEEMLATVEPRVYIPGVSPDKDTVVNDKGAKQSKIDCLWTDFPPEVLVKLAQTSKQGATKYGLDNWRDIPQSDHINHALTHVFMHLTGDTSEAHLLHATCRLIFALGVDPCGEK
jgi:hypothetical protein